MSGGRSNGPVLWETTITIGISAIAANESPSVIRQNPPPESTDRGFCPGHGTAQAHQDNRNLVLRVDDCYPEPLCIPGKEVEQGG